MNTLLLTLITSVLFFQAEAKETIPVTSILNSNRGINHLEGFYGSVDLSHDHVEINRAANLNLSPTMLTAEWNLLGEGIYGYINTMVVQGNDIYVGGDFVDGAGIPDADYLARWDGCEWHAVVPGIDGPIYSLIFNGSIMYAGGYFTGYVAKLEGGTWSVLTGINNWVLTLEVNTNGLYAGGFFTDASENPDADGIARWNGSSWDALGTGIELGDYFIDIETFGNDLYLGGYFFSAGGVPNTQYIARWDGNAWYPVGDGLNSFVTSIQKLGTNLYVIGAFHDAGGNSDIDEIAMWDGNTWNSVGSSPNFVDWPFRMSVSQDYIYTSSSGFGGSGPETYRYDILNDTWDLYPPSSSYASALLQIGSELYLGYWDVWRWGEPSPSITISGIESSICEDATPISLPTIQDGYTGNWSGDGVSNNIFNPEGQVDYVELLFTPDPGQCVGSVSFFIYVYIYSLYFELPSVVCENIDPIPLTPFQNGIDGEWSGPGVINNEFDPSDLNGSIIITFTPDPGQCYTLSYGVIYVEPSILPDISGIPNSICEDSNPISLPTVQDGIQGNWTGEGVINNFFNPSGLNGIITLTFTPNSEECADENTTEIEVDPVVMIIISGVPNLLCQLSSPIALPVTQSGLDGNWSGPGVTNNSFNPEDLDGNIILTFTPNSGQCGYPTTTTIQVYLNIPEISGIPESVCESDPPVPLPTSQSGFNGNWSGQGVINNIFYPTGSNGEETLYFTPLPGQCAITVIQNIEVIPLIVPTISGIPDLLCNLSQPIELPEIQNGIEGSWTGPGVIVNQFDPSELSGEVILIFFPEPGQCASSANTIITVQDAIVPLITGVPAFLCEDATPKLLPDLQSGIPGYWSGPGVINNYFNPSGLNGNSSLTFTPNASECAISNTWIVTIDTSFIPVLAGLPASVCQTDPYISLSSVQTGFNGTWSGPGVSNDTFYPAGLTGIINLTFNPNADQCAVPVDGNILINIPIHPVLSLPDSLCQNDDPVELSSLQDSIPGVWAGPGIDSNFFNPVSQSGNIIFFFLPDNGACEDTARTQLFVQTQPSTTNLSVVCDSVSNTYTVSFGINGGDSTGYMVDGVPVLAGNYISEPYPFSATYYSFVLEDGSDCGPVSILGSNSCLCFSDAGTMNFNEAPFNVCKGPEFTVTYNGDGHPDADDLLLFVLHDNAGNQLGNVHAVNSLPVFHFVPGLLTGHTYYISSVAGTNNGNGVINLLDPCLSVSNGVPVTFFECEPDADNTGPVSLDKEPFDQPFSEETEIDQNFGGGNGINGKMQTSYLNQQWASVIDDPHAIIKEFSMYDLYGRLVYDEKDIPGNSFLINLKNNIQNSKLAQGFYVFTLEVEMGNGKIIYMNGCRVFVW